MLEELSAHIATYGTGEDGLLFHSPHAAPIRRSEFNRAWVAVQAAAGVVARFHDLRHAYASRLISEGCSVRAVADALGHASPVETLRTYSHLMPADHGRIRAAGIGRPADLPRTRQAWSDA